MVTQPEPPERVPLPPPPTVTVTAEPGVQVPPARRTTAFCPTEVIKRMLLPYVEGATTEVPLLPEALLAAGAGELKVAVVLPVEGDPAVPPMAVTVPDVNATLEELPLLVPPEEPADEPPPPPAMVATAKVTPAGGVHEPEALKVWVLSTLVVLSHALPVQTRTFSVLVS